MSYSTRGGLGQVMRGFSTSAPVVLSASLPASSVAAYMRQREHDQDWMRVSDDSILSGLSKILHDRKATDVVVPARIQRPDWSGAMGGRIGEGDPFLIGLKSLWIRLGRQAEWWPGARGEFNFGPNTDAEQSLRIAEPFYEALRSPQTPMWRAGGDGFVHLWQADHLYKNLIRSALIRAGYLDRLAPVSTKDDSAMVAALRRWYSDSRALGRDVGAWAGDPSTGGCPTSSDAFNNCLNFGPNVNGDEIRLHSKMIADVVGNISAREAVNSQAAMKGAKIRPPVVGMLTNIGGKNRTSLSTTAAKVSAASGRILFFPSTTKTS